jgi:hypothetical protein
MSSSPTFTATDGAKAGVPTFVAGSLLVEAHE